MVFRRCPQTRYAVLREARQFQQPFGSSLEDLDGRRWRYPCWTVDQLVEGGVDGQGWKATDKRVSEQEIEKIVIDWGMVKCTVQ